jgi:hypothetical protein
LGLAVERIGERKAVVDIFSLLLDTVAVFVVGAVTNTVLAQPKVWDPDDWAPEELEEINDYDEMRKENPHIWID